MKRSGILVAAALVLLVCALALKGWMVQLPAPQPAYASGFSAERAKARLAYILGDQRPHPVDSEANDAVRARLAEQMRAVGLDPKITNDFACNSHRALPGVSCARVRNLVATIGPSQGRHILAVAHYDSTPTGPGAADDGIGVATLLDVADRLRGKALGRPVTFLINEGEEAGLLGARAFMERHPIAPRVEALVNLEARGVEGPAIMFETSQPNGAAIATYARTAKRPVGNSLTADFYRLIPNSTDVAVFQERGWTTLNYAVIANETRYHSAGDTLDALSSRSLQHMGDQALAAILGLANREAASASGQRHYSDFLGRGLVVLPEAVSLALLGVTVLLLIWIGWRRRARFGAVSTVVAAIVGSSALVWLGQFLVGLFRSGQWWRGHPEIISLALGASALLACAVALVVSRKVTKERLRSAFWLVFAVLGALACIAAPGAAILIFPPALVAAAGMTSGGKYERMISLAAALLLFLLFAPLLHSIETLLGYGSTWMFASLAALILLPWMVELKPLLADAGRPALAVAGGVALLGWSAAAAAPAYTQDRQQRFSIEYAFDANRGAAKWAVANGQAQLPDSYSAAGPWTTSEVPWSSAPRWTAPAPKLPVETPRVTVLRQREVPGGRQVTFRLSSAGARSVVLQAPSKAMLRTVRSGTFTRPVSAAKGEAKYTIGCSGRSCAGAVFDIVLASRAPVEWLVIATTPGLPTEAKPLVQSRPIFARPQYTPDATISISRVRM
jgi:hypothetical protein